MEVILRETMPNLGEQGEVIKVKPGYARNYLIPKGFAFATSTGDAKRLAHQKRILGDIRKRQVKTERDVAARVSALSVRIAVKVGEEDRMFGSVTSAEIAEKAAEQGIEIDRRKIVMDDPIRALGIYTVPVRYSADVTAEIRVRVVKEDEEE